MPITEVVSLETYLNTSYHPDLEYIDGVLCEKPVTEFLHGIIKGIIQEWFRSKRKDWDIACSVETRSKVSSSRIRLPDVVVVKRNTTDRVVLSAPILVIEVKSESDRISDLKARASDFMAFGTRNIWLIEPETRVVSFWIHQTTEPGKAGHWEPFRGTSLSVIGFEPMYLDMDWVWSEVDDSH